MNLIISFSFLFLLSNPASSAEIFVNPLNGNNDNPGTQEEPLRDFSVAMNKAQPGDTIRMVSVDEPLRCYFPVKDKTGTSEKPIIIDGGFNTYIGTVPVDDSEWERIEQGLYKRTQSVDLSLRYRYFMCFNGQMNRMGQQGKWTVARAPLKPVGELADYEWTIVNDTDFYFRIPSNMTPAECRAEVPSLYCGVQLSGESSYLVFRNIIAKNFWNDGFNIHNNCRNILFENVAALGNGDDGVSAHETCQIEIQNYVSIGNATGICHIQNADCAHENVYISSTTGRDIYLLNSKNKMVNMAVDGNAPGGIEFGADSTAVSSTNQLEQCSFLSNAPNGWRFLRSQSLIIADDVISYNYKWATLPAGWVDVGSSESVSENITVIKEQLFTIFGGRLSDDMTF